MAKQSKRRKAAGSPVQKALAQGLQLHRNGQLGEAERIYRDVLTAQPENPQALHLLGYLYFHAGQLPQSKAMLQSAVRVKPKFPEAWYELGNTLRDLGELEEATKAFQAALRHRADFAAAHCALAEMRDHATPDANEAEWLAMKQTYARSQPGTAARRELAWGMARASEQREEVDNCLAYLAEAHAISADASTPFDLAATQRYLAAVRENLSAECLEAMAGSGSTSELPIFVFGLPRSGTSLVEQILASHSVVHGAGELRLIGNLCGQLERQTGETFARAFASLQPAAIAKLAEEYLRQLTALAPMSRRIVDKMPANFMPLGMLAMLFPKAKFIHCRRGALANCWSIYSTKFAEPHGFADSLEDLGGYHRAYVEHMAYWNQVLPGRILEVEYEKLVAEPDTQIRRLIDHCDLPMEESCLQFHRTSRVVRTASTTQVRRPIYDSAVNRFQLFEAGLAPLGSALGEGV